MRVFFRCVAEAVAENGISGLASMVPGGVFAYEIARISLEKYRHCCRHEAIREEMQSLARAGFDEARQAAAEVARDVAAKAASFDEVASLELFLTAVPAAVQQSLKRNDDPTGTIVPLSFALDTPDDVLRLLPPRPPKFRPSDALPGKPGWVLEKPLGIGGFGEVWLAKHPRLASLCGAVKFCHALESRDRDLLHEGGLIDRIMTQGRHPNVVPLLDAHLDGDAPWLMFEYVEGGTLLDAVREWQAFDPTTRRARAIAALGELVAAVGHFHRLAPPVVHRDLKPSNVLVERGNGRLRITDFGIGGVASRLANAEESRGGATQSGRLLSSLRGSYTPLYSSPQQRNGDAPDPRDDIHALGVLGYQMLTGHLTFGAGPDFADDLRETGADEDLIGLLGRCVAQKAERRPQDAGELAELLTTASRERQRPEKMTVTPLQTPVVDAPGSPLPPLDHTLRSRLRHDLTNHDQQIVRNDDPRPYLEEAVAQRLPDWRTGSQHRHPAADLLYGLCLLHGIGLPVDRPQGMNRIHRSADQGMAAAEYHLGVLHRDGGDHDSAHDCFAKAADQGYAPAHFALGAMAEHGQGEPRNPKLAAEWYRKAAVLGHSRAAAATGRLEEGSRSWWS